LLCYDLRQYLEAIKILRILLSNFLMFLRQS
jgi:hypothetical protein